MTTNTQHREPAGMPSTTPVSQDGGSHEQSAEASEEEHSPSSPRGSSNAEASGKSLTHSSTASSPPPPKSPRRYKCILCRPRNLKCDGMDEARGKGCRRCAIFGLRCVSSENRYVMTTDPDRAGTGPRRFLRFEKCKPCIANGRFCDRTMPCMSCLDNDEDPESCKRKHNRNTIPAALGGEVCVRQPLYFYALGWNGRMGFPKDLRRPDVPGPPYPIELWDENNWPEELPYRLVPGTGVYRWGQYYGRPPNGFGELPHALEVRAQGLPLPAVPPPLVVSVSPAAAAPPPPDRQQPRPPATVLAEASQGHDPTVSRGPPWGEFQCWIDGSLSEAGEEDAAASSRASGSGSSDRSDAILAAAAPEAGDAGDDRSDVSGSASVADEDPQAGTDLDEEEEDIFVR